LERVERREQQMAELARLVAPTDDAEVAFGPLVAALPADLGRSEELVDGGSLLRRRGGVHQMEVHGPSVTPRLRR